MKKEFTYRGKTIEELQALSLKELMNLFPARQRRSLSKERPLLHKRFFQNLEKRKDNVKTQCRDIIIMPSMIGKTVRVYNGKSFEPVIIVPEMIGHYLGEFVLTRRKVAHNAPGIGATRSSASLSVR
ncbi:30S ribosomal protein S19 [Candidatus Woesearchaeota archaeon]|nr:30S ribosomal protein S19 [Candidatus Woesearchaeota archaeon]